MKYFIVLLSVLFFVPAGQSSAYIEPYGNIGGSYSSSVSSPFMNYGFGARLGYSFLSVRTGLDVFWTNYNTAGSSSSKNTTYSFDPSGRKGFSQGINSVSFHSEVIESFRPWSIGAFVALDLPIWFNAYGSVFYTFGTKKAKTHHGYGAKMGVSYLLSLYVQLNLEFQWAHYRCPGNATSCNNFNIFSTALSLSLPFSFNIPNFGRADSDSDSDSSEDLSSSSSSEETENSESDIF